MIPPNEAEILCWYQHDTIFLIKIGIFNIFELCLLDVKQYHLDDFKPSQMIPFAFPFLLCPLLLSKDYHYNHRISVSLIEIWHWSIANQNKLAGEVNLPKYKKKAFLLVFRWFCIVYFATKYVYDNVLVERS